MRTTSRSIATLIARGVSDYVVAPFPILEFIQHVSHLYTVTVGAALGRLVAVMGAKGGVGASTVAHNLAWSIATSLETQTVIADLDLAFGTAGLDFNQDPPQGVAEAVFSPERVDANLVDRLLSKCGENLHLLAAPATTDRPYDLQELALEPVLDVLRATTPCTVLDIPHQWTSWVRHALTSADELVLVANPDLANLRNSSAILEVMRAARPNDRTPKLVLNNIGAPRRRRSLSRNSLKRSSSSRSRPFLSTPSFSERRRIMGRWWRNSNPAPRSSRPSIRSPAASWGDTRLKSRRKRSSRRFWTVSPAKKRADAMVAIDPMEASFIAFARRSGE